MDEAALLPGIAATTVETPRLRVALLTSGPEAGAPVIFLHGNVSSARFWEETLAALPPAYRGLAPDLRGFGDSETSPVDATRGLRDFSDDLHGLIETLGLNAGGRRVHLVGWSTGGGVAMQYAIGHAERVASIVLVAPLAPYGFGGTKDAAGTPCWPDHAGSGAGGANPEFVGRLAAGDRGAAGDTSPRNVLNTFYFRPPFRAPAEREEVFLSSMLRTKTGAGNYPGDAAPLGQLAGVRAGGDGRQRRARVAALRPERLRPDRAPPAGLLGPRRRRPGSSPTGRSSISEPSASSARRPAGPARRSSRRSR